LGSIQYDDTSLDETADDIVKPPETEELSDTNEDIEKEEVMYEPVFKD